MLVCISAAANVNGSNAQQYPLCTDSYAEFESASVALYNVSGNHITI